MLIAVGSAEEADVAIEGGADRLVVRAMGDGAALTSGACEEIGRIATGRCPVALWMPGSHAASWALLRQLCGADEVYLPLEQASDSAAEFGGARRFARLPFEDGAPETAFESAAREGFDGVLLCVEDDSRRLLQVQTVGQLQQQVHWARARKLIVGFAGRIEAPDIPRLLAMTPDFILFDGMVRQEGRGTGPLDPERLRYARDLMSTLAPTKPSSHRAADSDATVHDRIFVRDWLVEIQIGAYAYEREPQRVRFTVEVEVVRVAARAADLRHVVTYDLITDSISRATIEHVDLVETVAEDVASAILMHPRATMVDITVEKLDLGTGSLGCRLLRRRDRPL
ncbi:dihydroneopterin aldolase [Lichenifustis flavocetrariae]|uniref:(5-formylfuran-3-yl)methyl phosphate synthase n=1 Tax=Lichenifustis flavocetrariae TaxID=2949735 RepID=A0AA42CKJ8_9HYPH|nr:dihydroneopterin aldolase [Lichenifustis flavocetrariae]MCW6510653.1 dihydroneopterin aldolase [Lichenifustis flavocetrariae]